MDPADLIAREAVVHGLRAPSKRVALTRLAERAAALAGLPPAAVVAAVLDREKRGTTAFGGGTAIPHVRVGVAAPLAVIARLDSPLEFGALDAVPVDLVVLLLAPRGAGAGHLRALACLSRMLRDVRLVAQLRGAADADALHALISAAPRVAAA